MIPLILCTDVEPDAHVFQPERPSPWSGFETMLEIVRPLRDRLGTSTGRPAHFGWSLRIDPQVAMGFGSPAYVAEKYRAQLDDIAASGDAIGLHPHAWRWDADRQLTVAEHGDKQWLDSCAELAVSSYRGVFGRAPDYHRFGAGYMSTPTMNLLRNLGVTIDLTVEPGEPPDRDNDLFAGAVWTGHTADFRLAPTSPYRPSPGDYLRPADEAAGDGNLWEVPLTSGRRRAPPLRHIGTRLGHPVRSARGVLGRVSSSSSGAQGAAGHRMLAMWLHWPDPRDFWDAAFDAANRLERPYMAFAVRTDTGCDPVLRSTLTAIMDHLSKDERVAQLSFVTPAEALAGMGLAQIP